MSSRDYCFTKFFGQDLDEYLALGESPNQEAALDLLMSIYDFGQRLFVPRNRANTKSIIRYLVCQFEEAPTTGRIHLQGFVQLSDNTTINTLRQVLPDIFGDAHLEKRLGTPEEARDYCKKPATRLAGPYEFGQFTGQGFRSDLQSVVQIFTNGGTHRTVAKELPGMYIRFHGGIKAYESAIQDVPEDKDFAPRPWQATLLDKLAAAPCDRKIHWIKDAVGGKGKSRLGRHLLLEKGAIELSGKLADMMHGYCQSRARIVIFDISRAAAEHSDHFYSMAEHLKNGKFFTTKYDSKMVIFSPPHVVFFANFMPDMSKWSADRYDITDLDANPDQAVALRFM